MPAHARAGAAVEVILPVLDEAEALPWVLARMPADFVPLVVDNGSRDASAQVAARLGARVVYEPRRGFGAACWAGLCAAESDTVKSAPTGSVNGPRRAIPSPKSTTSLRRSLVRCTTPGEPGATRCSQNELFSSWPRAAGFCSSASRNATNAP